MDCLKADVTVLNFFGSYSSRPSTIVHDTWVEHRWQWPDLFRTVMHDTLVRVEK